MSKIFVGSWIQRIAADYWKRFVGSVTGFARNYREDFFIRTEVNIIALHVLYGAFITVLAIASLFALYHNVVQGLVTGFAQALTSTSTSAGMDFLPPLQAVRTQQIVSVVSLILGATLLFGYLVARHALSPTRNALAVQKQFIGNIAHELRTPLSIIKTNIEVRLLDPNVPEVARKMHQSNLEELDRLSDIINNLLSLNALVRPEQIPFGNVDVGKIVHRVVEKLSDFAGRKPIRIRVKIARERTAWGNAAGIEQVVANILKNAIQHTASGEIVVSVGANAQQMLEFTTRDTGTGIKRQDLFRIFEPFYRGDSARTRAGGAGSGLGLSIVSELVKLHHGKVNIQSAPGHGTNVIVTLPLGHHESSEEEILPMSEVSADFSHRERKRQRS